MPSHSYGYKPSKPDVRDFRYASIRPLTAPLPSSIDLRSQCSPVRDQGQLGSCTGFALVVGLMEMLELRVASKLTKLSPLFTYYEERLLEGTVGQDAGAEPRDGLKSLTKVGVCPETDDKYVISKFTNTPSKKALTDATKNKLASYHSIPNLLNTQVCLAGGNGVVMGFNVYESFESDAVASTGIMPMPSASEQLLGGHAVFAVGYKTDPSFAGGGCLIVKNSWSAAWGDKGYFYMPFAFVTPANVSDLWTARV